MLAFYYNLLVSLRCTVSISGNTVSKSMVLKMFFCIYTIVPSANLNISLKVFCTYERKKANKKEKKLQDLQISYKLVVINLLRIYRTEYRRSFQIF